MSVFKLARAIRTNDVLATALILHDFEGINAQHIYLNDFTPLGFVVTTPDRDTSLVDVLVDMGADVNFGDEPHRTPLSLSVTYGTPKMAERLVERGANMEAKDDDGFTPLHKACLMGRTGITKVLVRCGADINARTNKGATPLDYAIDYKRTDIQKILLQAGAKTSEDVCTIK